MDTTTTFLTSFSDAPSKIFLIIIGAIVTGIVGFYFFKRQRKIEKTDDKADEQTANRVAASKSVWALMKYLEPNENRESILVQRGTPEKTVHYVNLVNAMTFIDEVAKIRSNDEHSIYLPTDLNAALWTIRVKLYQFVENVLRKDARKAGVEEEAYFHQSGGFFQLVNDREEALVKQKNPKWRADYREKVEALKEVCKQQVQ
jgi:hypothetical protein